MGLSLTGISGASGILPPPPPSGGFNWSLLPNVPTDRRSAIETACNSAASGQAYTASDVFTLLSTATYWWSFEQGSIFTSSDTSVVSNSTGDIIGCARDWIQNALITATGTVRPTRASVGLDFDGSDDTIGSDTLSFVANSANPYSAFVVGAPLRAANTKGGALLKAGASVNNGQGGFGIGCGSSTLDSATNPNQIALHEHIAWLDTATPVSSNQSLHTFSRASGTSRVYYGGSLTLSSGSSIQSVGAPIRVGGYVAFGGVNRHINCRVQSVFSLPSWSATSVAQIHRFLNAYYALGLSL